MKFQAGFGEMIEVRETPGRPFRTRARPAVDRVGRHGVERLAAARIVGEKVLSA